MMRVDCRPVDAAGRGHIYAIRARQNVAYGDHVQGVRLAAGYLAHSLLDPGLVLGRAPSSLAVAQDASLDKLGVWVRSVASQPQWLPLAWIYGMAMTNLLLGFSIPEGSSKRRFLR